MGNIYNPRIILLKHGQEPEVISFQSWKNRYRDIWRSSSQSKSISGYEDWVSLVLAAKAHIEQGETFTAKLHHMSSFYFTLISFETIEIALHDEYAKEYDHGY